MDTVIDFLGECRIFVGNSVVGVPFLELERAGFTTWEIAGHPRDFLDEVHKSQVDLMCSPPVEAPARPPELKEISPGCYFLSLIEIQNCSGSITSKQVLLPLLSNKRFDTLELACSHVPPWLEVKIISGEINATIDKVSAQDVRITIRTETGARCRP